MLSSNWPLSIIRNEHKLNQEVLKSNWLPPSVKTLYGRLRSLFGRLLYRSRFCPVRTSPTRITASVLRRGDVYLDVGASEGQMVCLASAAVGPSGRVYAFEPRTSAFQHLQLMSVAYRLTNVELFQSLVGDSSGESVFFENVDNPSSSSLSQGWAGGVAKSYPVITLDEWSEKNSVSRVDLVKIDVEGAEMQVLRGGLQLLQRTHPLVIFEIGGRETRKECFGYSISDLTELLGSVGYAEFYCLRGTGCLALIKDETDIQPADNDILACTPGRRLRLTPLIASRSGAEGTM